MTDKDIIIIWLKKYSFPPDEYELIEKHIRKHEYETKKIIDVPDDIVEKVERL